MLDGVVVRRAPVAPARVELGEVTSATIEAAQRRIAPYVRSTPSIRAFSETSSRSSATSQRWRPHAKTPSDKICRC